MANDDARHEPAPTQPASAGRQVQDTRSAPKRKPARRRAATPQASLPVKERLFAHPGMAGARENGGLEQVLDKKAKKGRYSDFKNYFSRPYGLGSKDVTLRRLKVGSQVIGGTDPKPILDGWKLLEATAIYRADGKNALYGGDGGLSIGQVLLLPKPLLEKRVLHDPRIDIYPGGQNDIRTHQIDRRVLAVLEYLAESGLKPTVSCLKSGHSLLTTSGNVSEHVSGNAVDISRINGIPILGHQDRGGIAEQTVRMLMRLQGTMQPHQIISLLDLGANTMALPDHADHVHVGFHPLFGDNKKLGKEALVVLKPGQWSDLIDRLRRIDNPVVPTKPSRYAVPVKPLPRRASSAHQGE